jgi:hypothetical protein
MEYCMIVGYKAISGLRFIDRRSKTAMHDVMCGPI